MISKQAKKKFLVFYLKNSFPKKKCCNTSKMWLKKIKCKWLGEKKLNKKCPKTTQNKQFTKTVTSTKIIWT